MSFTRTNLVGDDVLVEGTDVRNVDGSMVVNAKQWLHIKRHNSFQAALTSVDDAIEALLAPVQAAIDDAQASLKRPEMDSLLYVVEQEEVVGTEPQHRVITKLSPDSVILRVLEDGQDDRLIWVNDRLVLTAETSQPPAEVTDVSGGFDF